MAQQVVEDSAPSDSTLGSARDDWVNITSPLRTTAEGMKAAAAAAAAAGASASNETGFKSGSGGGGGGSTSTPAVDGEDAVDALSRQ